MPVDPHREATKPPPSPSGEDRKVLQQVAVSPWSSRPQRLLHRLLKRHPPPFPPHTLDLTPRHLARHTQVLPQKGIPESHRGDQLGRGGSRALIAHVSGRILPYEP